MEKVTANKVEIVIAGKNITGDVSPYLSKITYTDKEEAESDDISLVFEDTAFRWQSAWYPEQGDSLQVKMGNSGNMLDCGLFEIDEIELEFPPDTFSVKAVAVAISKSLRTKNSKAFEKQTINDIARYFAGKHSLTLTGNKSKLQSIEIERKTQDGQTDIAFLSSLAKDYGIIFSVRGNQLVFMDSDELDALASVVTIDRRQMSKARFRDKTSHIYDSALVTKRDARSNTVLRWEVKAPAAGETSEVMVYDPNSHVSYGEQYMQHLTQSAGILPKNQLIYNGDVDSDADASAKAQAKLKEKNREKITGSFSVAGNAKLVAGINIQLTSIGKFTGKWHVISSSHSVEPSGGYVTDVEIRKIL
jgi:phage protein D